MNYKVISLLLLVFFKSCGDTDKVQFGTPQPIGQSDLNLIPKNLRGTYLKDEDSGLLTITSSLMVYSEEEQYMESMDSVKKELTPEQREELDRGLLTIHDDWFFAEVTPKEDSAWIRVLVSDTVFQLADDQLIRKYKGDYFLNYQRETNNWKVRKLTLKKDKLTFSRLKVKKNLEQLEQITEIEIMESDSGQVTGYKLQPSKKQLRKLMKQGFEETSTYTRKRD